MFSPPRQIGMKAGADLEQRADPAIQVGEAFVGIGDARQDLQQRALARAVAADDADDGAGFHFEGDVFQGPERVLIGLGALAAQDVAQPQERLLDEPAVRKSRRVG